MGLAALTAISAQSEKLSPIIAPNPELKPSDAPQVYGPDTLYQKINGQAEFYLAAGFVSLKSQWYETVENAAAMIEVNIFHMGNLMNAFSVFSLQRRDDAQPIDQALRIVPHSAPALHREDVRRR